MNATEPNETRPPISLSKLAKDIGVHPGTLWRWRRNGWLTTTNICGKLYVLPEALAQFNARLASGEFSKDPVTPDRKSAA